MISCRRAHAPSLLSVWLCLLLGLGLGCFFACAPTQDTLGLALRQGQVLPSEAPDSLRADLEILPSEPRGAPAFSARVFLKPHNAYRLEAFGIGNSSAASLIWAKGSWTLLLHPKREVWTGFGDSMMVEGESLRLPDVHAVLGFLWGESLPGLWSDDAGLTVGKGSVHWNYKGVRWQAFLNPGNGACYEIRSPALSVRYGHILKVGKRVIPESSEIFYEGRRVLTIKVRSVEDNPVWQKDPFSLPIPDGYQKTANMN